MKKFRLALIIAILMVSVLTNSVLAEPSSPEAISAFTILPSPVYPGNEIVFHVAWNSSSGLSADDGHALCFYYTANFNQSLGLVSDGFYAADDVNFLFDVYAKEGPSSIGEGTTNCPAWPGYYVVGYVLTEGNGGVWGPMGSIDIPIIVPREAQTQEFTLMQLRCPDSVDGCPYEENGWELLDIAYASVTITPAGINTFAGIPAQCGTSVPCYPTIQEAVDYVADGGTANVMGDFTTYVQINGRNLTLQSGNSSASITITADENNAISVVGEGTVVIKDLTIVAFAEAVAINVGNGNVTVKGCDINANNSYGAFGCNGGNLSAYANNITNVLTAVYGTGCEANLKHNYWGVYNGDPAQFGMDEEPWIDDWNARLGNEVDTYADGYITTGGSVTLGGASLIGGTGTAVIVSHGKSNPPFGNGISQYIYSMCGEYYDFFVRGGSGAWSIVLPVDNNTDCNANVLNKENVYSITDIADCDTTGNPACWDPVPKENISIPGQSLMIAGLTAGGLEGTQYVVGSSDGTDPTVIQLRSLTATSVRNVLPLALLMLAILLGSGGLILARKRR